MQKLPLSSVLLLSELGMLTAALHQTHASRTTRQSGGSFAVRFAEPTLRGEPSWAEWKQAAPRTPTSLHTQAKGCPMSNQGPHIHLPPTAPSACWQRAVGEVGLCPHPLCIPQQVVAKKGGSLSTHLGVFVRMQHEPLEPCSP